MSNDLGGSWLGASDDSPTDDELTDFLQSSIPEPAAGYWQSIDARLGASAPGTNVTDMSASPMRQTSMNNNDVTRSKRPQLLLAAAALLLIGGLAAVGLRNRSQPAPSELATAAATETTEAAAQEVQPTPTGEPTAVVGASQGAAITAAPDPTPTSEPTATPVPLPGTATQVLDGTEPPLTAIQARLDEEVVVPGRGSIGAGPYCFSSDQTLPNPFTPNGTYTILRLDIGMRSNAILSIGDRGESDFVVRTGRALPTADGRMTITFEQRAGATLDTIEPVDVIVDDTSISVQGSSGTQRYGLVTCDSVWGQLDELYAAQQGSNETVDVDSAGLFAGVSDLSSAGLGPIRIGMTVSEISEIVGVDLPIRSIDGRAAGVCGWVDAFAGYADLIVEMTGPDDGIVRRVSTQNSQFITPSGIAVGSAEQTVRTTFEGRLAEFPHEYVEGWYLTFQPVDDNDPNTVQFVIESGVVAEIRAGDRGWVGLVEGCA